MKLILRGLAPVASIGFAIFCVPVVALAQSGYFQNPTAGAGIGSLQDFIAAFLRAIVEISLPILTLFFVYAGFLFVIARGNQDTLSRAKRNFLWAVVGAVFILGAWTLATLLASTATQVLGS